MRVVGVAGTGGVEGRERAGGEGGAAGEGTCLHSHVLIYLP